MKKLLIATILLIISFGGSAKEIKNPLMASETVVWAGLDYSMMRMIGNADAINVPDLIFQDMPQKWNDLFLDERIEGVANSLGKRVFIDIGAVTERNKTITTNQIVITSDTKNAAEQSHITKQDIAAEVQSFKLEHKNGLGLVFIVDRMVYQRSPPSNNEGGQVNLHSSVGYAEAVYVVFFNVATHEVISAKREIGGVNTGGSFRNFWFGPIKDIDSRLDKYR